MTRTPPMAHRAALSFALLALLLTGCGDDDGPAPPPDGGMDGATDGGSAVTLEDLPIDAQETLAGLSAPVEAIQDERGTWHIYGSEVEDVFRTLGYLQAVDRMGQMDFVRRSARGRTAEFAGSLDPSLVDDDADARFEGYSRLAAEILPTLDVESRALLDAYSAGVNHRIAELRAAEAFLPRGVADVVFPDFLDDWTPIDTLSIARLQAAALSYDARDDVAMSQRLAQWAEHFPADAADPRIARLADAFHDVHPFYPSRRVWVRDGFPNTPTDSGTRARRFPTAPAAGVPLALPSLDVLDGALTHLERTEARFERLFGDEFRGSNSWVVDGTVTASGHPILSNDPHLALTSPPLFWQAHLDTERMGGEPVQVAGQMIVGTPAIILGFNQHLAWGLTTHGYDVTDAYLERITPGTGGAPDTVEFDGAQVPIEKVTEVILDDLGTEHVFEFERVPHHGLILPESRTDTEAISVRWTGNDASNEAGAFLGLMRATDIDEAEAAIDQFEVGGQTFVVVTRDADIFYTSQARIPVRMPAAVTYDPATRTGDSPCLVLPGHTGLHEWDGDLSEQFIPHELNPTRHFIATANGDAVGVTDDGDPHDDDHFLGCYFDSGHRIARITERLEELTARGGITPEDMMAVQGDGQSNHGRQYRDVLVAELDRAAAEAATPGTHPDLADAVADAGAAITKVATVRERLVAWTLDTPAAVEGSPAAEEIADSVATTIFNVAMGHLARLFLYDESDWMADGAMDGARSTSSYFAARALHYALTDPAQLTATYDATLGDTVLWDDLGTDAVESRGDRVLRAFVAAIAWLEGELGSDMDQWRWGKLHTLRLRAIVPEESVVGRDELSIPPPGDTQFPNGFPRHGDRDSVDASNFGIFNVDSFSYGSGPQQRLVVDMGPDGPTAWNSIPGGNSEDPDSAHQRDQMEDWRHNVAKRLPFTETEVVQAAERRIRFEP